MTDKAEERARNMESRARAWVVHEKLEEHVSQNALIRLALILEAVRIEGQRNPSPNLDKEIAAYARDSWPWRKRREWQMDGDALLIVGTMDVLRSAKPQPPSGR